MVTRRRELVNIKVNRKKLDSKFHWISVAITRHHRLDDRATRNLKCLTMSCNLVVRYFLNSRVCWSNGELLEDHVLLSKESLETIRIAFVKTARTLSPLATSDIHRANGGHRFCIIHHFHLHDSYFSDYRLIQNLYLMFIEYYPRVFSKDSLLIEWYSRSFKKWHSASMQNVYDFWWHWSASEFETQI